MATRFAAPIAMAMMLAGCGSIGAIGLPVFGRSQSPPPPVQPSTVPPVETNALPPPPGTVAQQDPFLPQTPPPANGGFGQVATANPPLTAQPPPLEPLPQQQTAALQTPSQTITPSASGLGRTDLLGGWTITAAGDSCQLFMTLTSWTGGYRASTRGCSDDTLKSISAWNLQGDQVVLSGQGGSPVARLYSSGNSRFDGQTEGQGAGVSFFR